MKLIKIRGDLMLEEIKEVLISEMQRELHQRKRIEEEIQMISNKRDQKQEQAMKDLTKLESQIESVTNKSFHRIFHGKEIKSLLTEYTSVSNNAREEIKLMNNKIESLYQRIHDLSHDEILIEREIDRVRRATSFQELGLTEREALKYIKNDERKVIRAVFKNIKDNDTLETSADIDRNMSSLYQTNLSPFVLAMQKISIDDLVKELIEIEIVVDEDKIKFLKDLRHYAEAPEQRPYSEILGQERTDRLDNNFYNQAQDDLAYMQKYSSYPPLAISKIITLAVLVSMAKAKKQEKQNQK